MAFKIGIVGHGVGKRMYQPVLEKLGTIEYKFLNYPHINIDDEFIVSNTTHNFNETFDLILIGSPPFAHKAHLKLALNQSNRVVCEKPFGLSSECPEYFLNSTYSKKLILPNYQLRFNDCIRKIKKTIIVDDLIHIDIIYHSGARLSKMHLPKWYFEVENGGSVKYSLLPHFIDILIFLGISFKNIECNYSNNKKFNINNSSDSICLEGHFNNIQSFTIDIESKANNSQFLIKLFYKNNMTIIDLITGIFYNDNSECKLLHPNGILSSSNIDSVWQVSFKNMLTYLINSDVLSSLIKDRKLFLKQAINVHNALEMIT